jgi:uncharacterized UBP type Zn finger protein
LKSNCEHLESVPDVPVPSGGCEECLTIGDTWVHLRFCVVCGKVGCCESSKNKHASKHASATDHPVVRSKEPGEHWAYCYADDAIKTLPVR